MGPQSPRGQPPQASSSTTKLAGCLPFPAGPALPRENPVSPPGKTELAARGRRPLGCGEGTCPASPGCLPRASDLLPGISLLCSGIHTNQSGGGEQRTPRPLPSSPVLLQADPRPLHSPPRVPVYTRDGKVRARPFLILHFSYSALSSTQPYPLEKGGAEQQHPPHPFQFSESLCSL